MENLLSGKFKEAFLNWMENKDLAPYKVMFDEVPLIVQQSYIIQFFDEYGSFQNGTMIRHLLMNEYLDYNTISEATTEAINMANSFYNQNNRN